MATVCWSPNWLAEKMAFLGFSVCRVVGLRGSNHLLPSRNQKITRRRLQNICSLVEFEHSVLMNGGALRQSQQVIQSGCACFATRRAEPRRNGDGGATSRSFRAARPALLYCFSSAYRRDDSSQHRLTKIRSRGHQLSGVSLRG